MRIKLRQLEVFNAIYDAGSVSRAAQRLNLSQPAVSIALGKLEEELGFPLFHRDRGFFAPTNEAILLQDEVRQGIAALGRVEQRIGEIRAGATGGISVATNGALAINFLPGIVAAFQSDYPGTHVELRVHSSRQIANWTNGRQIDIGFIDAPVPVAGLHSTLYRMECVCIMRDDNPLADLDVITPEALSGRSVIAVMGDHNVDRQLKEAMAQADARLEHTASGFYFAIMRKLVAAGGGVAIIDPVNAKAPLADGVIWRPFAPAIYHDLVMLTHRGHPLGLAARRFRDRVHAGLAPHSEINEAGPG